MVTRGILRETEVDVEFGGQIFNCCEVVRCLEGARVFLI